MKKTVKCSLVFAQISFTKMLIAISILLSHFNLLHAQPGVASVNGISIAYYSFGTRNKEVILLIAGTNAQLTMWPRAFCDKLVAKGFRVIAFDNRDIGL